MNANRRSLAGLLTGAGWLCAQAAAPAAVAVGPARLAAQLAPAEAARVASAQATIFGIRAQSGGGR